MACATVGDAYGMEEEPRLAEYLCVPGRLASGPFPVPYSVPSANAQTPEPEGSSPGL